MIEEHLRELSRCALKATTTVPMIEKWADALVAMHRQRGRLLICGNGGSAAEAQHLSAELVGRFCRDRPPISAIALNTDSSAVTAICNDYGPEYVFSRQVHAHACAGDIVLALSTSGESPNVLVAAKSAQEMGLQSWAMTGPAPNSLTGVVDDYIAVEGAGSTVQEVHLALIHSLCLAIDHRLEVR